MDDLKYGYDKSNTTIRLSIRTKNKLKTFMKPSESFDQLISRVLYLYEDYKNELNKRFI